MSFDFAAARTNMVESQVRPADVTDYAIQDAMRVVPRERALPAEKAYMAYADVEVEYAPGRWLMRPRHVAQLLQAVRPQAGERALAIAAPYAAMVMEAMGVEVIRLDGADLTQPPPGPFDVIVCEGAVSDVPPAWTEALALGGRLGVAKCAGRVTRAHLYLASSTGVGSRDLFDCAAPVMAGFEPALRFAF